MQLGSLRLAPAHPWITLCPPFTRPRTLIVLPRIVVSWLPPFVTAACYLTALPKSERGIAGPCVTLWQSPGQPGRNSLLKPAVLLLSSMEPGGALRVVTGNSHHQPGSPPSFHLLVRCPRVHQQPFKRWQVPKPNTGIITCPLWLRESAVKATSH